MNINQHWVQQKVNIQYGSCDSFVSTAKSRLPPRFLACSFRNMLMLSTHHQSSELERNRCGCKWGLLLKSAPLCGSALSLLPRTEEGLLWQSRWTGTHKSSLEQIRAVQLDMGKGEERATSQQRCSTVMLLYNYIVTPLSCSTAMLFSQLCCVTIELFALNEVSFFTVLQIGDFCWQ